MRKIKITALLLAVLMIVTAFAGCASNSSVTNLDNKVNDLEDKIQEQKDALAGIQDSLKDISDAIGNQGSSELDDIKSDVADNAQSIDEIKDLLQDLKDSIGGATGNDDDVNAAVSKAGATIDALESYYDDEKVNYTVEDMVAIRNILGAAQASISNVDSADKVDAIMKDMEDKLTGYRSVNGKIYDYYVALKGHITADSADLAEEAYKALEDAQEFYLESAAADIVEKAALTPLTVYKVNGEELNLIEEIYELYEMQFTELPYITAEAEELNEEIEAALADFDEDALDYLYNEYKDWKKAAEKLSPDNVKLVKYDDLKGLLESIENVRDAIEDFNRPIWADYSVLYWNAINEVKTGIFDDYKELVDMGRQNVITYYAYDEDLVWNNGLVTAPTMDIYETTEKRLAEFQKEYGLDENTLAFVIEQVEDEYFYERYLADKALLEAFEAEYETLEDGVFKAIKALNSKKLSIASSLDLVNAYKKNAEDINAWRDEFIAAYIEEYDADEDAKYTRNIDDDVIDFVVEQNFNAMVAKANLGVYHKAEIDVFTGKVLVPAHYSTYNYDGGFLEDITEDEVGVMAFYHDFYDFTCSVCNTGNYHAEGDLCVDLFLTVVYPVAEKEAEALNEKIDDYKENEQVSIEDILVNLGGYYWSADEGWYIVAYTNTELENIAASNAADGKAPKTVAEYAAKYTTPKFDLSGLINTDIYEKKLARVEERIVAGEAAAEALYDAYKDLYGKKDCVVITMDNADEILALEPLFVTWLKDGNVNMKNAIVEKELAAGVAEYSFESILVDYDDFYWNVFENVEVDADILQDTDAFVDTWYDMDNAVVDNDTSDIVRLVWRARQLKNEAAMVVSIYEAVKALDSTYKFATLNAGATEFNKEHNTDKPIGAKFSGGKFTAVTTATTGNVFNGKTGYATDAEAIDYLFGDGADSLATMVKTYDYVELINGLGGLREKVVPAYMVPVLAMYLEAKFEINNMGKEYEAIEKAKNGWATDGSSYGFEYIKGMTVAQLRYTDEVTLNDYDIQAISGAKDYEDLRSAVENAIQQNGSGWTRDIVYGHGDATWLAKTYDITKVIYHTAPGGTELTYVDAAHDYNFCHKIDLSKLEVKVLSIWEYEVPCAHTAPAGTGCCDDFVCEDCGAYVENDHDMIINNIVVDEIIFSDSVAVVKAFGAIYTYEFACTKACCAGAAAQTTQVTLYGNVTFTDVDGDNHVNEGDKATFEIEIDGVTYEIEATRGASAWTTVYTVA